ncbi:hypothetical protein BJY52DRAFT_1194557 [Lactarius psammicola]|nr:hypothetical protein BJY52DRAFT_1194557 [Lactarius psammicola]
MPNKSNLPPRDPSGWFTSSKTPTIVNLSVIFRTSSPSTNPSESPLSDTTTRACFIFPSPIHHPLPRSFPLSENSVLFSQLVVSASSCLRSLALSSLSSSTNSLPPDSSSPDLVAQILSPSLSLVSFSDITRIPSPNLNDSKAPDTNLDPSPSYHSTIATPSTSAFPAQISPQKKASSIIFSLDTPAKSSNQDLATTTSPLTRNSQPSTLDNSTAHPSWSLPLLPIVLPITLPSSATLPATTLPKTILPATIFPPTIQPATSFLATQTTPLVPAPLVLKSALSASKSVLPVSKSKNPTMLTASGPAAMPTPHSNKAPYFTDQSGNPVEVFLWEYENLAITHGLTSLQKVEQVLRYVLLELCDLWQFLDGYMTHSWSTFKRSIEEIYEEASVTSQYSKQWLREFIKHMSKSRMANEDDMCTYYKRFLVLSKPLMENNQIMEEECNAAF